LKTLVTGGSGFLGSHVADALTEAGHQVTIFDTKPSPKKTAKLEGPKDAPAPGSIEAAADAGVDILAIIKEVL